MMAWQRDNTVDVKKAASMTPEELEGKIIMGVFKNEPKEEYTARYQKIIDRLK